MSYASKITLALIKTYQRTISPNHGSVQLPLLVGSCRFYPSCSAYTYCAITQRGFLRGIVKGFWRVLRCNPYSKGGYDPVEEV